LGFFGLPGLGWRLYESFPVPRHGERTNRRDVAGLLLRDVALQFAVGALAGILGSLALGKSVATLIQ